MQELEFEIMGEIGFGEHSHSYEGSESCIFLRRDAAERLYGIIQRKHNAGRDVSSPDTNLSLTLKEIAERGEDSEYTSQGTADAARRIIRTHVQCANLPETDKKSVFKDLDAQLRKEYLASEQFDDAD